MISLIITTNDPVELRPFSPIPLDEPHPDLLLLESTTSIGIDAVRTIKHFTSMHPMKGDKQVIWLKEANRLTNEAQNALLKVLEEPPTYTQIILSTTHPDSLLPTVISRCKVITTPRITSPNPNLADGERDNFTFTTAASEGKTKDQALAYVKSLIASLRNELQKNPHVHTAQKLKMAEEVHYRISKNANPQLALEYLLLTLKKSD